MIHRDPRSTPKAGDIVRSGIEGRERHVNSVYGDEIVYWSTAVSGRYRLMGMRRNVGSLETWRRWCADANGVVLARGEDG